MSDYHNQEVHAPYHFVPLSKWVYMPDWAHLVSHDVPFKNGYSGVIDYTLTNATPLCVGGEQDKNAKPTLVKWARDPLDNPVIPGSSLKGMIRNVLEIASFGKFNAVDDNHFSFRDISSKSHYLENVIKKHKVMAGWVKFNRDSQKWTFTACDFAKVSHKEIKSSLGKRIENEMPAQEKYQNISLNFSTTADISEPKGKQKNRWAEKLGLGRVNGHFVFTNNRIYDAKRGKKEDYEFSYFFFKNKSTNRFDDIQNQVSCLFSNHSEDHVKHLKENGNVEHGIPVFALITKERNPKLHSLGFAKMPRVSYKNSVKTLINSHHNAHNNDGYFDLAELMFGSLRDNGLGLKSRVTFSDGITDKLTKDDLYKSSELILNGPKPSFFPAYLEQKEKVSQSSKYNDYDASSKPSGWKRYIAKKPDLSTLGVGDPKSNDNVSSQLELAPINSSFKGKIAFHNLTSIELGALIWCLQLSGNKDNYHQLGHGKPFGAGAVQIQTEFLTLHSNGDSPLTNVNEFQSVFIQHMNTRYPIDSLTAWQDSPQIKNLLAFSALNSNEHTNTAYMSIDNSDYQQAKNKGNFLESFNGLPRSELGSFANKETSLAFGEGRLSSLINKDNQWENELLTAKQNQKKEISAQQEKARLEQEETARKATLSPCELIIDDLKKQLSTAAQSERPPLIRTDIAQFMEENQTFKAASAKALWSLAREYEYHQKPKKRAKDQKIELKNLLIKYGLEV